MNLRPIKDGVIVRPDPPVTQIGLIHVPETVNADNPNYFTMTGTVVAVGPGGFGDFVLADENTGPRSREWLDSTRQPMAVKVGDRVCYNRYAGKQHTCDDDGVLYLVMRETDVIGIVPADAQTILPGYQAPRDSGAKSLPLETTR